ncbi:AGE family epimerase/isomerase [Phenylobacterium koreense]|uniref:Mannose-1-phosphate guanylyltransferase/mannose-6-phosphate isomerase n=1 Tax=Phenylobacterium koreense TaxID=266125 RepID=A0ABV2EPM1_9CAUL
MAIVPVIMCGGGGTRLWPSSRPGRPKQFLRLLGERSLFQETIQRLAGVPGLLDPVIVAGVGHEAQIVEQLGEIGQTAQLVLEPTPRDSGPAVAAAVLHVAAAHPEAVAVVLASDHHIPDVEAFRTAIFEAVAVARHGRVVVLGVRPDAPSSAYGYIEPGDLLAPASRGRQVRSFVEKPDAPTARRYVGEGRLWNSGNFVAPVGLIAEEFQAYCPQVIEPVAAALAEADWNGVVRRLSPSFAEAAKISFDYAVMEKTDRAAVLPVDFVWSDLGAWDAVWAAGERTPDANSVSGSAVLIDTAGAVVRAAQGMMVSTVGVKNVAVIVERDAVLVCALDSAQSVKSVVEQINERSWAPPQPQRVMVARELADLSRRLDDWLDVSALPLWWSLGADHRRGGFHERLSLNGRPVESPRRARVQMRQAHVYATAGALGWSGPWRQAMEHGIDYFERRYRRADGQFRTLVGASGDVIDDTAMLYDQAFALLGWASAAIGSEAPLEAHAVELLRQMRHARRCAAGGFYEAGEHANLSNPHMHLFEAALAWLSIGRSDCWQDLASEIATLALERFIDPSRGYLREHFDADWRPARGDLGRIVEPGHQFEWSWLLARWFRLSGDKRALEAAKLLFQHGCVGVDAARGVAVDALDDDLKVRSPQARLWPQTERLKAALLLGEIDPAGGETYELCAQSAARSMLAFLDTPVLGVWRDKLGPDGAWKDEPAPASSLYHIAGAIWEFRRVLHARPRPQPARLAPAFSSTGALGGAEQGSYFAGSA